MNTISILVRRSSEQLRQRLETKGAFLEKMPFRCCWSDCGSAGRLLLFIPEYPADSASQKHSLRRSPLCSPGLSSRT